ncbi:hypothetical protein LCGC14_2343760, partial [marine sediment metagenome]
ANVLHTDSGPIIQLFRREAAEGAEDAAAPDDPLAPPHQDRPAATGTVELAEVFVSFDGSNAARPVGVGRAETVYNYFLGDEANWRTNVPAYEKVVYPDLYDGIDLHTWGRRNSLKYEFHVAPGADYTQVQVSFEGIDGLSINAAGALHVQTELGELIDDAPYIYQEIDGERVEVAGSFELIDGDGYTFSITGEYDPAAELIIDPLLSWSTYMGGSALDWGNGIAVDSAGGVYVTGETQSPGWASGGFDTSYNGYYDIFVAKLTPSGGHAWSTYMGGSLADIGYGIAVDPAGGVYVTGGTWSAGWASGGFDTSYNGYGDIFVAKLTPSGGHAWSTYMGGSGDDYGYGIAVDPSGGVFVTGRTPSSGWASGGFDTSHNGGNDIFVAKLTPSGGHAWSTYMGGSGYDIGSGIVPDPSGGVYVTGYTHSPGWASGGFDSSHNGGSDIYAAKLTASGGHAWSTYMGGSGYDSGWGIALDPSGGVYVTGETSSSGWASGGFDTSHNGGNDIFVAKLTASGGHTWSTYMGGSGYDRGWGIAVDPSTGVYVTGETSSSGWASGGF